MTQEHNKKFITCYIVGLGLIGVFLSFRHEALAASVCICCITACLVNAWYTLCETSSRLRKTTEQNNQLIRTFAAVALNHGHNTIDSGEICERLYECGVPEYLDEYKKRRDEGTL